MAHLLRLIFALACFWAIGPVYAVIPPAPGGVEVLARPSSGVAARWVPVVQGCTEEIAIQFSNMDYSSWRYVSPTTTSQVYCLGKRKSDGSIFGELFSLSAREGTGSCPANSTLSGSSCVCTSPYVENAAHTACELPPNECQQKSGQPDGIWRYDGGYGATPNPLASELCKAGTGIRCIVKVAEPVCTQGRLQGVGNPFWTCRGTAFYTGGWGVGAACNRSTAANGDGSAVPTLPPVTAEPAPDDLPPNTAAPTTCPPGTFEGTVNGTHTCVEDLGRPSSANSPQSGQNTIKNPDGSTTTTTTIGTTTCSNGSCTTTNNVSTNITNNPGATCPAGTKPSGPNGSATSCSGSSTSSTTQAQTGFCEENPKAPQCGKGDGEFGGSCAAGFIATGEDPIINAMALEQYKRNCQMFETDSEERKGYEDDKAKAKAGTDLTDGMSDKYKRSVSVGPGDFDSSSAIAISQCIRDIQVSVHGLSISLPFSRICPYLEYMGTLLMAVSYLLAARILVRG